VGTSGLHNPEIPTGKTSKQPHRPNEKGQQGRHGPEVGCRPKARDDGMTKGVAQPNRNAPAQNHPCQGQKWGEGGWGGGGTDNRRWGKAWKSTVVPSKRKDWLLAGGPWSIPQR